MTDKISHPVVIKSYFPRPNNTKYLVPSQTLIILSTLSNLIHNGFAPIKVLYQML